MIIKEIPLKTLPNQILIVQPSTQSLTITIYLQGELLYCDVVLSGNKIITGAKCLCGVSINQYNTDLIGYLTFYNKKGTNPVYTDLGINSILLWSDLPLSDVIYANYVKNNSTQLQDEFG